MDNMLGKVDEKGVFTWPKTDILGAAYVQPASRVNLNAQTFVVIPAGFDRWELIEDIKNSIGKLPNAPKPKSKAEGEV